VSSRKTFHEKLSWLLDNSICLPGGYRIGLDGFIGLIPGLGDFISGLLSSLIIVKAHQQNVPRTILFKMFINVLIDTVIGSLPLIGDVFDFIWKANQKNSKLLEVYEQSPKQVYQRTWLENIGFMIVLIALLALAILLISWLIGLLWSRLFGY